MARVPRRRAQSTGGDQVLFDLLSVPAYIFDDRTRQFLAVNAAALERYGYTREQLARTSGTLFLDEAGELPLGLQPKLLRAVEFGEVQPVGSLEALRVDVRVIAATNRDLRSEAAAGRFRPDLYYRLRILEIHLPPLRERREDIPYLVAAFTREFGQRIGRTITSITPAAERRLQHAAWPGNIRELRNAVERACILGDGATLSESDIDAAMATPFAPLSPPAADAVRDASRSAFADLLTTAQCEQIHRVLREVGGNKAAAKRLGVSRRSLYRWLDRLDVDS
jgi:transcriptional regulator with GAF, ATPase, and Fis domain